MLTVDKIKQYCIETDMANINAGCTSVGTFIYGKFYQFRDLHDVELFYANISLKELLTIYSEYNGLECYKISDSENYRKHQNLDILNILESM